MEAILAGLGMKKTGHKDDLVDRILGRETVEKRKKKPKWRNSKARAMLVRMLMDQNSNAQEMTGNSSTPPMNGFKSMTLNRSEIM